MLLDINFDLSYWLEFFLDGIAWTWEFMYSIKFLGTNLLVFNITLILLAAFSSVIITSVHTSAAAISEGRGRFAKGETKSSVRKGKK